MTDTTPDKTKRLARRLTPSQRTLSLALVLLMVAPAISGPVGQVSGQQAGDDAAVVFTASDDNTVRAIDTETQTQIWNFTTPSSGLQAIAVGPNGETVYAGGNENILYAIDTNTGTEVWRYDDVGAVSTTIDSVAAGPDGDRVYFGARDGGLRALSASDGSLLWNFTDGGGRFYSVSAGPDGNAVYSVSTDDVARRHDVSTGFAEWNHSNAEQMQAIDAGSNGNTVYIGDDGGTVRALGASGGSSLWTFTGHSSPINSLSDKPDATELYTAGQEPSVRGVDTGDQTELWSFSTPTESPVSTSVAPSGQIVYTGWVDDTMRAIDTDDGSVVWTFNNHTGSVNGVASTGALAGHELTGRVEDQRGQAVEGATVTAEGASETDSTTTEEDGTYSMTLLDGTYNVTASADGYVNDSATVTLDADTTQDFTLIEESAALSVQARHFMEHGERTPYSVRYGEVDDSGNFVRQDVTNSTTATTNNSTVVTVDAFTNDLVATNNEQINHRTHVTFNYTNSDGETFSREHNVTVANTTVENLDILPPVTRFTATLGDKVMQTILIATGVAVVAAILAGAFSGIAAFTVIMCMGWVMRIVPDGTIIVVVLTAAFIGMNVAGNVDYTVRR